MSRMSITGARTRHPEFKCQKLKALAVRASVPELCGVPEHRRLARTFDNACFVEQPRYHRREPPRTACRREESTSCLIFQPGEARRAPEDLVAALIDADVAHPEN